MAEIKAPLGRRELDVLTLGTEEALLAYKEQRLELRATRETRDERKLAGLTKTKSSTGDEIVQVRCRLRY
jgi:ribosomal protein L15E